MKPEEFEKRLIAVARNNPPGDHVPPAFAKRIMALISARAVHDVWAVWASVLWRAVGPCVAVMLLFSAWALFHHSAPKPSLDLAQQLDNTLLAAVDQDNNDATW